VKKIVSTSTSAQTNSSSNRTRVGSFGIVPDATAPV
jgi:hypothetical protein